MSKSGVLNRGKVPAKQYLISLLSLESAVVLKGIKPSVLININRREFGLESAKRFIHKLGLSTFEVFSDGARVLLMIFDEHALNRTLKNRTALKILSQFGYNTLGTPQMLQHLSNRCSDGGFPHEIGIFLGYPPKDVMSFIEHGGKNCLACGYWKVYHDLEQALHKFEQISKVRSDMAYNINCGVPFYKALASCIA